MSHIALTVDDDKHTLYFLEQVLKPLNIEVIQAEDGSQAINILEQTTPTLLFLDMLMPDVTGVNVLDFILHTPRLNSMFVVVLSAHNHFQSSETMVRVDHYLVKPVRLKVLKDIIQQVIAQQAAP